MFCHMKQFNCDNFAKLRMLSSYIFTTTFVLVNICLAAQVTNNDFVGRIELLEDSSVQSKTNNSSVEWSCAKRKLTARCLVYHNDQWFFFKPTNSGTYYINISAQKCRDSGGVQIFVLTGDPCVSEDNKLVGCISRVEYNDSFLKLDSLVAGKTYYVNIDGFLGDFCSFEVGFSRIPKGLPLTRNARVFNLKASIQKRTVGLKWSIGSCDSIAEFELYRKLKGSNVSVLLNKIQLKRNAAGKCEKEYSYKDDLLIEGVYEYFIVTENTITREREINDVNNVLFYLTSKRKPVTAYIPANAIKYGIFEVMVFDDHRNTLVTKMTLKRPKLGDVPVSLSEWVSKGVRRFRLVFFQEGIQLDPLVFELTRDYSLVLVD